MVQVKLEDSKNFDKGNRGRTPTNQKLIVKIFIFLAQMFKQVKTDFEDFAIIIRGAFATGDSNPHNQVSMAQKQRIADKYNELTEMKRKDLETDHEPDEVEECIRYVYPKSLRGQAKTLCYDFTSPLHDDPEYVEYYREKMEKGEITETEFRYERAHHNMYFGCLYERMVLYAVTGLFLFIGLISLLSIVFSR